MTDIVYDAGTEENFIAAMKSMNLWVEPEEGQSPGPIQYGNGWFLNIVGPQPVDTGQTTTNPDTGEQIPVMEMKGYWARLRWLRDDPVPATPSGVVEYADPETQPPIGMIA